MDILVDQRKLVEKIRSIKNINFVVSILLHKYPCKRCDILTTRYYESLWETIKNFQREQGLAELTMEADVAGGSPPQKKRRVRDHIDRMQSVVLQYEEIEDVSEYLRGVAHNLVY